MKTINTILTLVFLAFALAAMGSVEYNKKMIKEINLNGSWKFTIINYDNWETNGYNDSDWEEIRVPASWESQGYNGYNGYGYYRKEVVIPEELMDNQLFLILGYVDDVDEVYFNGRIIGATGSFPPKYRSGWDSNRAYLIPASLIRTGERNTIAVKVFDMTGVGGITKGNIGIYMQEYPIKPDIDLVGEWKFNIRNKEEYKQADYDDSRWSTIVAPGIWENQGYRDYNGTAWYRKEFVYDGSFDDEMLVMLAGKIDDVDQVFLNGEWIGQTGHNNYFKTGRIGNNNYHLAERGYLFPAHLLKRGKNVIAIKVIDGQGAGGISDGPLGIIEQSTYISYWKKRSSKMRAQRDW